MVEVGDGQFARASIALRVLPKTRRIRAFLRWSHHGKTTEEYLGEVEYDTRAANLAEAWRRAWDAGLLTEEPPPADSWASSPAARSVMRGNRGKDTKPELRLRSLLHQRGLRYRVDVRPLPGVRRSADIVFPKQKIAVFVDGCFWHACPEHHRPATKNAAFWHQKIQGNRERDLATNESLRAVGWTVIRIWEHEDPEQAAQKVEQTVRRWQGADHPSSGGVG
ncbi:very short patch repair endonuclease [Actinoallomurus acaciae]|uniref:Very short patch repair endonuclease n=1 Tax=Actinoallomurus acaciae TaxID=502577 RepID=A0ABV5YB71_9ACTN